MKGEMVRWKINVVNLRNTDVCYCSPNGMILLLKKMILLSAELDIFCHFYISPYFMTSLETIQFIMDHANNLLEINEFGKSYLPEFLPKCLSVLKSTIQNTW